MNAALVAVGTATVAAIIVGLGAWLVSEFIMGTPRSEAITTGAIVAGIVLFIGAVFGVFRSARNG